MWYRHLRRKHLTRIEFPYHGHWHVTAFTQFHINSFLLLLPTWPPGYTSNERKPPKVHAVKTLTEYDVLMYDSMKTFYWVPQHGYMSSPCRWCELLCSKSLLNHLLPVCLFYTFSFQCHDMIFLNLIAFWNPLSYADDHLGLA